jgi:DNA polymerase-3 subunit gamma/tau
MSYEVLARKWRPRQFRELVGQEHVVRALSNALDNDRLHHAYLFTGTRGVGKTTLARIFAKSLNCEQGVSATPCGECNACRELDDGRFVDLLEVDAASRTKVDQTRELLENVPYAPARGRYKVYLIDEVHMFSDSSFNALLKTLEEPPPHVKFLLATTDPQKVPMTVLSRCLQFGLKRLTPDQISGQLQQILESESLEFDATALPLLAAGADGSMRDGLSLLDQAIAFGGGRIGEEDVRTMLGVVSRDAVTALLAALAEGDAGRLLAAVAALSESGPDYGAILAELLRLLHRIALLQLVPDAPAGDEPEASSVRSLSEKLSPEDVQLFYEIGVQGQRNLPFAPDPRSGLEMILLRMLAFRPDLPASGGPDARNAERTPRPSPKKQAAPSAPPAGTDQPAAAAAPVAGENPPAGRSLDDWAEVVGQLKLGGIASQLAAHSLLGQWKDGELILNLDPGQQTLCTRVAVERLEAAVAEYLGQPVKLRVETVVPEQETPAQRHSRERAEQLQRAQDRLASDPLVRAASEKLGGRLIPETVVPGD